MELMQEIKELRERLAQLEREARNRMEVGVVCEVISDVSGCSLSKGDVVVIDATDFGDADGLEISVVGVTDRDKFGWVRLNEIERISKERA